MKSVIKIIVLYVLRKLQLLVTDHFSRPLSRSLVLIRIRFDVHKYCCRRLGL